MATAVGQVIAELHADIVSARESRPGSRRWMSEKKRRE